MTLDALPVPRGLFAWTPAAEVPLDQVSEDALRSGGLEYRTIDGRDESAFERFVADADCPNQAFRTGPAARLPECRGYEMVTPVEKGGFDIVPYEDSLGNHAAADQSALDGGAIVRLPEFTLAER